MTQGGGGVIGKSGDSRNRVIGKQNPPPRHRDTENGAGIAENADIAVIGNRTYPGARRGDTENREVRNRNQHLWLAN